MTQEEKARAYDEALERARALRQEAIDKEYAIDYVKDYEAIFPELAESEDERIRKWLIDYFSSIEETVWIHRDITCEQILAYLEKQKEQKPAEWSEEDEDMLNSCISSIEEAKENRYAYKETDGDTSYDREIDWLKSLRPLPQWKPSEEQMKALCSKLPVVKGSGDKVQDILETLYYDLKKRGVKEEPDC